MTLISAFLAFVITIAFMFSLRPVAVAVGLVDVPGGRKRHDGPVPVIGGIAMVIGLGTAASLVDQPEYWNTVLMAILLMVAIGTIDDRFDLPAQTRLIAQCCAALLVTFGAGVAVQHLGQPFFFDLPLGPLAPPFTVLFIVTLINGFNVIDGLDGLAGGLAFLALVALAIVGFGSEVFPLIVILATVVAAFLTFNLPLGFNRSVRAFMGDAGATALGLAIACFGIALSQGEAARISPVTGLWLIAIPVFDLFSAIMRRVAEGRSPFDPDHEHLHHTLVVAGLSRPTALVVMLSIGVILAAAGVVAHFLGLPDGVLLITWVACGILYYQAMRKPHALVRASLVMQARVARSLQTNASDVKEVP